MKVAIIGAGLSGLTCAHELIRHGIIPTVFERKSYVGEVLDLPIIALNMFNMPISKPFKYLKRNFNLDIKPNYILKEVKMYSANKNLTVKSNLGYILKRGKYSDGIESQILQSINIPVNFNSYIDVNDIKNDFDYIIVATGTPNIPKDLNIFTSFFDAYVRIATVLGDFDVNSVTVWMNTAFAKSAFAYIVPNSKKDARLLLTVNNIYPDEIDYYWKKFLQITNANYNISNVTDIRHDVGIVKPVQYKNLLFCGNAGGFLDDALGFGSVKALLSGVLAAKCIIENKNYNKISQKLSKNIHKAHEFRKALNTFTNDDFDAVLAGLNLPGIKQYVYDNPFFKVTQAVRPTQIFNILRDK